MNSGKDLLWIVFFVLPSAFVFDLGVMGLVALWWYAKRKGWILRR